MESTAHNTDPQSLNVVLGAGPVGTTLALRLQSEGTPVRVVTRSGSGPHVPGIERMKADVTQRDEAIAACAGASVVFSSLNAPYTAKAWQETFPALQSNGVAAAGAAGARFVVVENVYMYGPVDGLVTERTPFAAPGAKGRFRGELSNELFAQHDVPVASVRAADFFGPHVLGSHVGDRFVPRILAGKGVKVVGDADAPHAFTYVPDLVTALITVSRRDDAMGRAWHAPMTTVSQRELAQAIDPKAKVSAYPGWMMTAMAKVVPMIRELDEMRYQFDRPFLLDDTDIRTILGVERTPLAEQVEATVSWWRSREQQSARAA